MQQVVEKDALGDWVGKETAPSEWLQVDQDRINAFAECTLDPQFIHTDPVRAKAETPFGGTIAHGFLTLSLLPHFLKKTGVAPANVRMGINYGLNKCRFLNPVKTGSRVRAAAVLQDIKEKRPGELLLTFEVTVQIEGEETPALVAESLMMYILA